MRNYKPDGGISKDKEPTRVLITTEKKRPHQNGVAKTIILYFVLLPFLIFVIYGALNYSGFCFKKMRYLSDEEKIRMATTVISKGRPGTTHYYNKSLGRVDRYRRTIPYESTDIFLQENPGCCKLIPKNGGYVDNHNDDRPPTFWERITGKYNYAVRVKYLHKYIEGTLDEKKNEGIGQKNEESVESFYPSGSCGEPCYSCFEDGW